MIQNTSEGKQLFQRILTAIKLVHSPQALQILFQLQHDLQFDLDNADLSIYKKRFYQLQERCKAACNRTNNQEFLSVSALTSQVQNQNEVFYVLLPAVRQFLSSKLTQQQLNSIQLINQPQKELKLSSTFINWKPKQQEQCSEPDEMIISTFKHNRKCLLPKKEEFKVEQLNKNYAPLKQYKVLDSVQDLGIGFQYQINHRSKSAKPTQMLNQKSTKYSNNTQSINNKSKSNHVEQKLREYKLKQSVNAQNQSQTPNQQKLNALISKMHSENESKATKLSKLKQMKQQIASGPKLSTIDLVDKYHLPDTTFLSSPQSPQSPSYRKRSVTTPQIIRSKSTLSQQNNIQSPNTQSNKVIKSNRSPNPEPQFLKFDKTYKYIVSASSSPIQCVFNIEPLCSPRKHVKPTKKRQTVKLNESHNQIQSQPNVFNKVENQKLNGDGSNNQNQQNNWNNNQSGQCKSPINNKNGNQLSQLNSNSQNNQNYSQNNIQSIQSYNMLTFDSQNKQELNNNNTQIQPKNANKPNRYNQNNPQNQMNLFDLNEIELSMNRNEFQSPSSSNLNIQDLQFLKSNYQKQVFEPKIITESYSAPFVLQSIFQLFLNRIYVQRQKITFNTQTREKHFNYLQSQNGNLKQIKQNQLKQLKFYKLRDQISGLKYLIQLKEKKININSHLTESNKNYLVYQQMMKQRNDQITEFYRKACIQTKIYLVVRNKCIVYQLMLQKQLICKCLQLTCIKTQIVALQQKIQNRINIQHKLEKMKNVVLNLLIIIQKNEKQ
ncbi:Hypothetical_protein [Hexamita inflata]|uniref:Hypothetical_protein n=1 Tax=Hexamita inflata TaxID=28002 RepID=A0AA86TX67_9EUKA|nr:Hypothetical protein HINF_LOCUS12063 [Hexamita inflata]